MQEAYRDDPWVLLVGCILFNMVHGSKARPVLEEFLRRWPNYDRFYNCIDPHACGLEKAERTRAEMSRMFRPLGFQNRRTERICNMTSYFANLCPHLDESVDVEELPGIGKYGADSFNIFCRGYLVEDVRDKELRRYVAWALSQGAGGIVQEDAGAPAETGGGAAEALQPERGPGGG